MIAIYMKEGLRGRLLVAGAGLFDPNFRQTVILMVEHSGDGALGVVLNRPATVGVSEVVPALAGIVDADAPLFLGGPVQPDGVLVLGEYEDPSAANALLVDNVGLADKIDEPVIPSLRRARVFAGYAGWGAGQLETELESASWIIEPATPNDVFDPNPADLWRRVLRRKGGNYALLSLMPFDPSAN